MYKKDVDMISGELSAEDQAILNEEIKERAKELEGVVEENEVEEKQENTNKKEMVNMKKNDNMQKVVNKLKRENKKDELAEKLADLMVNGQSVEVNSSPEDKEADKLDKAREEYKKLLIEKRKLEAKVKELQDEPDVAPDVDTGDIRLYNTVGVYIENPTEYKLGKMVGFINFTFDKKGLVKLTRGMTVFKNDIEVLKQKLTSKQVYGITNNGYSPDGRFYYTVNIPKTEDKYVLDTDYNRGKTLAKLRKELAKMFCEEKGFSKVKSIKLNK